MILGLSVAPAAAAAGLTATFTKVSDWGSGFEGKVTVTNASSSAVNGWTIEFDLPAGYSVSSSWDAQHTASGQHHTFRNPTWAPTLAAGTSATFGFNGSPGNFSGGIQNCRFNGEGCDGGGGGNPGAPSTPANAARHRHDQLLDLPGVERVQRHGHRLPRLRGLDRARDGHRHQRDDRRPRQLHLAQLHGRRVQQRGESGRSAAVSGTTTGCTQPTGGRGAPYLYLGWGDPPAPATVMSATGVRWFTMAFVLSGGGCTPSWDSSRPLTGGVDQQTINAIRAAGGDVVPSFGGWQGNKLGPNCSTPQALAGAYQQVINAYGLHAIDIDIENTDEFENDTVRNRILDALKIVKQNNPGIQTIVTFGTTTTGPNYYGGQLIDRAAAHRRQHRRVHDHAVRLRRLEHLQRHGQRVGGPEEPAEVGVRLVRRDGLPAHGHLRHERPVRPAGADQHLDLDADPRLGQEPRPRPAGVLVGEPRPRLPGRRRGVQLQRHLPAGLGVHPDHGGLLTATTTGPGRSPRARPSIEDRMRLRILRSQVTDCQYSVT